MLILRLWNYFRGYVIINIEGLNLERFINMCIEKNIYLWNIQRKSYTTLEARVGIKGFKDLRKITRRCGCKISIARKNGYPFWAHKVKKRKMLLTGAFFSLLLIVVASSFIYSVDIIGNERVEEDLIINALGEMGLKPGVNRYSVNLREIENQMLTEFHQLAWVGIELRGIYAKIEVVEKIQPPEIIDKDTPCNVIAKKNGVIERIIARNGDAVVEKGDIVSEGDLLITGMVQRDSLQSPLYVHAYGEIYARTYYDIIKSVFLTEIKKEKTGEEYSRKMLRIGQMELTFHGGKVPFDNYILENEIKTITLWRNIKLPVEIMIEDYYEAVDIEERLDIEEVKIKMHDEAIHELMEEIPLEGEITNTIIDFQNTGDLLQGKFTIEVIENIAQQKKLDIEED
ncbi:sporulation protein YqfD [Alkaliphilus peptidifermentans]|uniref:Similar to stage IV sporulation protein n=1 Tax=Alkaliphilus peptidifermentans DSM 18978 TaxID=1120976 RepID=A0A1G5BVJ2_9FIRM|nr:sporulation protein YqfD [Alkaliphilus peptidifermentans]SCX93970.1 similar to stage IV sporulation protein [Alkaliphilus peptidifermentans DSM 18978]